MIQLAWLMLTIAVDWYGDTRIWCNKPSLAGIAGTG